MGGTTPAGMGPVDRGAVGGVPGGRLCRELGIRAGIGRLSEQDTVHRAGSAGTVGGTESITSANGGKDTETGNELGYGCNLFLSCITTNVNEGN